jgi:tetratricopeptide (TPR) repeat protein
MNREALANARELCTIDPQNAGYLRQLAFALDFLGEACTLFGEWQEAETALVAFRDNRQAAVAADPADHDALRSLALAYQHLGALAFRRRDLTVARASFQQGLTRFEELARRDPTSVMAFRDRTIAVRKFVDLEAFAGRNNEAAIWAARELEALTAKGVPSYPERQAAVAEAQLLRDAYRGSCSATQARGRSAGPSRPESCSFRPRRRGSQGRWRIAHSPRCAQRTVPRRSHVRNCRRIPWQFTSRNPGRIRQGRHPGLTSSRCELHA